MSYLLGEKSNNEFLKKFSLGGLNEEPIVNVMDA